MDKIRIECGECGAPTSPEYPNHRHLAHCVDYLNQQLADRDRELAETNRLLTGATDNLDVADAAARGVQARITKALAIGRDWCNQADRGLLPVIEDMCAALEGKDDNETPT